MKSFREILKETRSKSGLSQTEFGSALGVSRSYIAQLEGGKASPSFDFLQKISTLFRIDLNTIFIEEKAENNLMDDENAQQKNAHKKSTKNVHQNVHPNVHLSDQWDVQYQNALDSIIPEAFINKKFYKKSNPKFNELLKEIETKEKDRNFWSTDEGLESLLYLNLHQINDTIKCLDLFAITNGYNPIKDRYDSLYKSIKFDELQHKFENTKYNELTPEFIKLYKESIEKLNSAINEDLVNMVKFYLREYNVIVDDYKVKNKELKEE